MPIEQETIIYKKTIWGTSTWQTIRNPLRIKFLMQKYYKDKKHANQPNFKHIR